jgi:sulfur carrier protein
VLVVSINGRSVVTECDTLVDLMGEQQLPVRGVAIAVNRVVIARAEWSTFRISDDDHIEVVTVVAGG